MLVLGLIVLALGGQGVAAASPAQGNLSKQLGAVKDNTLFQSTSGSLSNGAAPHIWVGRNSSGNIRRGVLAFDVSGNIPAGASIQSATLTLNLSRAGTTPKPTQGITVHRLLANWGEGASNSGSGGGGAQAEAGDATWIHTFFGTSTWSNSGGDFISSPSATTLVGGEGFHSWTSEQMARDVQSWLDAPAGNFGWLLRGIESARSARRFDSRENGALYLRPVLLVEYSLPPSTVQFSSASYSVTENGGSATITITRTGSSSGLVSVDYAAGDGTAELDADYGTASGKITFGDGDLGDKTFVVPIVDNGFLRVRRDRDTYPEQPFGRGRVGRSSHRCVDYR